MTEGTKNYITPKGFEKLKKEYQQLISVERPKVVETVTWAASNGDRSENADYTYGKRRLREIDSRLRFLQKRMELAEVVDPSRLQSDRILFGATVKVENESGAILQYQIVGEDEWDVTVGKLSWKSPVARALMGKRVDDEVLIKKPAGEEIFIVQEIIYQEIF